MNRAVFLDRDGVLNRSVLIDAVPKPPTRIEEVEILEGVLEAIRIFKDFDLLPVVITNQPDIARGKLTVEEVRSINDYIGLLTHIDFFYTCIHDDIDFCSCRKPLPGLIHQAASDLDIDVYESFLVGDRWRDIEAGQAAGCTNFFIDYSYPERLPRAPFTRVKSLLEVAQIIVGGQHGAR
jgi:D-glycero-D-manno-heptose 1,7-bisphosphate phosphatase